MVEGPLANFDAGADEGEPEGVALDPGQQAAAADKIEALKADKDFMQAYMHGQRGDPAHERAVAQMQELYTQAMGNWPAEPDKGVAPSAETQGNIWKGPDVHNAAAELAGEAEPVDYNLAYTAVANSARGNLTGEEIELTAQAVTDLGFDEMEVKQVVGQAFLANDALTNFDRETVVEKAIEQDDALSDLDADELEEVLATASELVNQSEAATTLLDNSELLQSPSVMRAMLRLSLSYLGGAGDDG